MINKVTIQFEIYEGDVLSEFPHPPMPHVGLLEVLASKLVDGGWVITNADPEAPPAWVGKAPNHNEAILEYLKARLGILGEARNKMVNETPTTTDIIDDCTVFTMTASFLKGYAEYLTMIKETTGAPHVLELRIASNSQGKTMPGIAIVEEKQ